MWWGVLVLPQGLCTSSLLCPGTHSRPPSADCISSFRVYPKYTPPSRKSLAGRGSCRATWADRQIVSKPSLFKSRGFPGGAVVENLPANAGDTGSSPGLGGSHVPRSDWAREPQLLSLRVWSLCSTTGEAAIVRGPRTAMKSGPARRN